MMMAYDEHYRTAATSGPVASLPWVNQAVVNILEEVPREKLLLGLPFYNRIWREIALGDEPPANVEWGMARTREHFEANGVEWTWNASLGSYEGEFSVVYDGEVIWYRVWLECERSIAAKMQIFVVHDLAGVAGWRRLLETYEVQEVIAGFF